MANNFRGYFLPHNVDSKKETKRTCSIDIFHFGISNGTVSPPDFRHYFRHFLHFSSLRKDGRHSGKF